MTFDETGAPTLIPNLTPDDIVTLIASQLKLAGVLQRPILERPAADQFFSTNRALWQAVLTKKIRPGTFINLRRFRLSEWFPRTPGLFFTRTGRISRQEARRSVLDNQAMRDLAPSDSEESRFLPFNSPWYRLRGDGGHPEWLQPVILNPQGKISMLRGGVGSIRFRPKTLGSTTATLMAATSSAVAHEGFPLAVPDSLWERHSSQFYVTPNAFYCDILGRLQFVPDSLSTTLYDYVDGVPQVYLMVEKIIPLKPPPHQSPLLVSIPAGFRSSYQGPSRLYASYVTFNAERPTSRQEASDWLNEYYVQGMYKGTIISDFDEHEPRFSNAVISVSNVMNNRVSTDDLAEVLNGTGVTINALSVCLDSYNSVFYMRNIENMTERSIRIGNNTSINAPVIIADTIERSFITIDESSNSDDLKSVLQHLLTAINDAAKSAPPELAEAAANDADTLTKELSSSKPRQSRVELFVQNLRQTAEAIGDVGKPITNVLSQLAPLLVRLF